MDARRCTDRQTVYVEHGAGQTYQGADHGYAGAPRLDHVALFLTPSTRVSERWLHVYPEARVVTIGCPALDRFYAARRDIPPKTFPPVVTLTQHWRCGVVPETMPALHAYERGIRDLLRLQDAGRIQLVGHAHPRGALRTQAMWKRLGIRYEPDPDVVLATTNLLVADNTSLLYEAAALGIPTLSVNAPWYRRDVEHGLRFWSHVPGLQCDTPGELADRVLLALDDPPEARRLRDAATAVAYASLDGRAAERAALAILELTDAP